MSGAEFQTDALRPSSLPTATLGRRRHHTGGADTSAAGPGAVEDLDKVSEDWNVRIDREVKSVSSGLKDLIELADIGETPNVDTAQINALHLKLKTSQLVRSAQGLRDIAHELKLKLLLSNQVEEVSKRDKEAAEVGVEVEQGRKAVARGVARLLAGSEAEQGQGAIDADARQSAGPEDDSMDIDKNTPRPDRETPTEKAEETIGVDQAEDPKQGGAEDDEEEDEDEFELVA